MGEILFFSKNKIYTEGFDISAKAIQANKKYENKFLKFSVLDIENIKELNKLSGQELANGQTPNVAGGAYRTDVCPDFTNKCNSKDFGSCRACGSILC